LIWIRNAVPNTVAVGIVVNLMTELGRCHSRWTNPETNAESWRSNGALVRC
jgi:hypothetical protein